ncbi:DUF3618 domain-containing protein [Bradyrhizobium japonicum]|uniref:DUF3618 domain-containing protein n=1 Tax=Bradyrhizobium japonicum TaxID=375 RepID=UPI001BABEBF1|nr:DUF3618 domain-containing protein [Bradyrhizobium japonicum]MBR0989648.1 DUF3618 domain-containing protein [Bradyrhizobium japonicum]
MTRSVEDLRRESERSRAELSATVDRLKDQISDTTENIRHSVSPEHIKSEMSDYVDRKTQSWVDGFKQQIMDNPMRAVAVGTAVGVPLLRLARGVPLPLLMIGAGLALTSKTARDRAAEMTAPVMGQAEQMLEGATDTAQAVQRDVKARLTSVQDQVSGLADDAREAATGLADDLTARAGRAADTMRSGMDAVNDAAAKAPGQARQIIGDNAALISGIGIAIGAIIAAALPETSAESQAMGSASDNIKRAAGEAAQSGFEGVKDAAMSTADAVAKSVGGSDLGGHASQMTRNVADTLKDAADEVVTAAFRPAQKT